MPPGIKQNNNLLHLTMDVWQDQIFSMRPFTRLATLPLNC